MVTWGRISLLALALAALLAGCGGDGNGEIPADDASVLERRLNEVEGAVERGECDGARDSAALLIVQVGEGEGSVVPRRVDDDVHEQLQAAAANLAQLVDEQCTEPFEPDEEPEEPVDPPEPPPEEPEPTPEEDLPPEDQGQDPGSGAGGQGGGNQGQGGGNQGQGGGSGGATAPSGGTGSG